MTAEWESARSPEDVPCELGPRPGASKAMRASCRSRAKSHFRALEFRNDERREGI